MSNELQIVITSGKEAPQKALLGFVWALSAATIGTNVTLFFTMNGAIWTDSDEGNEIYQPGFESIDTYWQMLTEAGAIFEGCTSCVKSYCERKPVKCTVRPNVIESGLSTAAIRGSSVTTLIF